MNGFVTVREVGLRDGLQSIAATVPTDRKLDWIRSEASAGVREIEVTSFVPPQLLPQLADSSEVVAAAIAIPDLVVSVLVPNRKGAERALAHGVHKLNFVLSASEAHSRSNLRRSVADSIREFESIVALVRAHPGPRPILGAGISTAFGCTLQGEVARADVVAIARELAALGADEIGLGDTVGFAGPRAVDALFEATRAAIGTIPLVAHFHDTRGLGLANVTAALGNGVRIFDASLGGLGGCPYAPGASGNVATEDLVFLLHELGYETGIDLERLLALRHRLTHLVPETSLQGALARAGLPRIVEGAHV